MLCLKSKISNAGLCSQRGPLTPRAQPRTEPGLAAGAPQAQPPRGPRGSRVGSGAQMRPPRPVGPRGRDTSCAISSPTARGQGSPATSPSLPASSRPPGAQSRHPAPEPRTPVAGGARGPGPELQPCRLPLCPGGAPCRGPCAGARAQKHLTFSSVQEAAPRLTPQAARSSRWRVPAAPAISASSRGRSGHEPGSARPSPAPSPPRVGCARLPPQLRGQASPARRPSSSLRPQTEASRGAGCSEGRDSASSSWRGCKEGREEDGKAFYDVENTKEGKGSSEPGRS